MGQGRVCTSNVRAGARATTPRGDAFASQDTQVATDSATAAEYRIVVMLRTTSEPSEVHSHRTVCGPVQTTSVIVHCTGSRHGRAGTCTCTGTRPMSLYMYDE